MKKSPSVSARLSQSMSSSHFSTKPRTYSSVYVSVSRTSVGQCSTRKTSAWSV
jgi:hypothetical protein